TGDGRRRRGKKVSPRCCGFLLHGTFLRVRRVSRRTEFIPFGGGVRVGWPGLDRSPASRRQCLKLSTAKAEVKGLMSNGRAVQNFKLRRICSSEETLARSASEEVPLERDPPSLALRASVSDAN